MLTNNLFSYPIILVGISSAFAVIVLKLLHTGFSFATYINGILN
jgi:hypothetical protein